MTLSQDYGITGGRELDQLLQTLPSKVEKNIMRTALRAGAVVFLDEVKQRIPVASGQLRASARITSRVQRGQVNVSVKVGNSVAWYANLVEYGTKPHYISVSDEERGRGRRPGTLASMSTVNRRVLQIGGTFVGPTVKHPGAKKNAFMRPAADAGLSAALEAVTAKIRERLTKLGISSVPALPMDPPE